MPHLRGILAVIINELSKATHFDSNDRAAEENCQGKPVPPIWHLWIAPHKLGVDVIGLDVDPLPPVNQSSPMIQQRVHEHARREGKR